MDETGAVLISLQIRRKFKDWTHQTNPSSPLDKTLRHNPNITEVRFLALEPLSNKTNNFIIQDTPIQRQSSQRISEKYCNNGKPEIRKLKFPVDFSKEKKPIYLDIFVLICQLLQVLTTTDMISVKTFDTMNGHLTTQKRQVRQITHSPLWNGWMSVHCIECLCAYCSSGFPVSCIPVPKRLTPCVRLLVESSIGCFCSGKRTSSTLLDKVSFFGLSV